MLILNIMMKIGLFGGSFNPIHLGHLHIAEAARKTLGWDKVLFIPNAQSPLKVDTNLVLAKHRLAMVQGCVEEMDHYDVLDWEVKRKGLSYSIDTVRGLIKEYPNAKLYFLIGADSLLSLHEWKEVDELLNSIEFVVLPRPDIFEETQQADIKLPAPWPEKLCKSILQVEAKDISSTQIRKAVSEQKSLKGLVPASVEAYIEAHNLYKKSSE